MEGASEQKDEYIRARASTPQLRRIHAHCQRLNVSIGSRLLELFRRDILAHNHFDLTFEVGAVRKPRRTR